MKTQSQIDECRQRGFSLIELMVAVTLGFIVVGAVGYLFLGSRQSFRTTDNLSRMQENARYALESITRDVRMAGYIGCGSLQSMAVNTIANPPVPELSADNAITGLDAPATTTSLMGTTTITRPAGDAVTIAGAFGGGVNLTGNLAPSNANVQIAGNPYDFEAGDILIVASCTNADIFQATSVSAASGTVTVAHANSTNTGNRVGTYGPNDVVLKMEQYTYFIGINPVEKRALYRTSLSEGTVELVEDVWDMQIEYGVDTSVPADGAADEYQTATTIAAAKNWPRVVSARIHLLMIGPDNVLTTAQTYNFNGASVTPAATAADRLRMHQVFTTTVGLRNRLP